MKRLFAMSKYFFFLNGYGNIYVTEKNISLSVYLLIASYIQNDWANNSQYLI